MVTEHGRVVLMRLEKQCPEKCQKGRSKVKFCQQAIFPFPIKRRNRVVLNEKHLGYILPPYTFGSPKDTAMPMDGRRTSPQ